MRVWRLCGLLGLFVFGGFYTFVGDRINKGVTVCCGWCVFAHKSDIRDLVLRFNYILTRFRNIVYFLGNHFVNKGFVLVMYSRWLLQRSDCHQFRTVMIWVYFSGYLIIIILRKCN